MNNHFPNSNSFYQKYSWLFVTVAVVLLDRISKYLVMKYLVLGQPKNILPFLDFTFVYNPGAAFSFLSRAGGWQEWFFGGLAVVVSCTIILWIFKLPANHKWLRTALALILGGTLGNLSDRIFCHHVVDFLDFYYLNLHFATFNIADSAITVGAIMLMITIFFTGKNGKY